MIIDFAERARALVGTRFRPQGRDANGLDCIGVIVATFGIDADQVRRDYKLSDDHRSDVRKALLEHFRKVPRTWLRPGDLILMSVGDRQAHLAVRTDVGFVHAHAGIRRVVETPGMPEWPLLDVYRRRSRSR